jgi:flavodoxin
MKTLIFYATRSGNTRQVADALADALRVAGPVDVLSVDVGTGAINDDADLILVGGPTEGHGMTRRSSSSWTPCPRFRAAPWPLSTRG